MNEESKSLAVIEPVKTESIESGLPKIGEWFWVRVEEDPSDTIYRHAGRHISKRRGKKRKAEPKFHEHLMCVEHVASNHIQFNRIERESEYTEQISFQDFMMNCRPAPEWRVALENRMEEVRQEMEAQTRRLYEDAQKANALPPSNTQFTPTESAPFALAIRTLDPAKEKGRLTRLKKKIPEVVKSIELLAKEQAGLAKGLMLSELNNLYAMQKKLRVVEDKIFTLEVYAGLQEKVKQIADGEAAGPDTKITVRQSLLFMDEETLIDFDKGGMDFRNLRDFDEWVAKPESMARVLPEPRGLVAFRVRRDEKDYGIPETIWDAWAHMEMNKLNFATYLLIRNGQKVYRIASAVDFQPRLIPLKGEFDDAFSETHTVKYGGWTGGKDNRYIPDEKETTRIAPDNFDYDTHAEKLRNHLKQYNRVVVLLQGLLDRSEVFHPHPPINLADQNDMLEWLNLIRDEEGALGAGTLSKTWEEYRDASNAGLEKGDFIYSDYYDHRRRPFQTKDRPRIIQVKKIRCGNKGDVVQPHYTRSGYGGHDGRREKECVGIAGVEIEWDGGVRTIYPRWGSSHEKSYTGRMWIPLEYVFNLMAYQPGDYKQFLCDRTQKGKYLQWAGALLSAEQWHPKMSKL
jgi:hypothetical protein